jgi:hypothetical protein
MFLIQETFRQDALAKLNSSMLNAQKFAENMLEMAREIGDLNLRTGKAGTEAISSAARKMLDASNPAEFLAFAATVARPDFSAMHAYAEQLGGIATRRLAVLPVLAPLSIETSSSTTVLADVVQAAEAPPEALAAVAAEASVDMPSATPALDTPAASALTESIALESAAVMSVTPDAAEASREAENTPAPQPPVQASKADEDVVAEAALPADGAAAPAKIAKKAAASPAVLKAGVADDKQRDARKGGKAPVQIRGNTGLHGQKTKKPGM